MNNRYAPRQSGFNLLELMITLMIAGMVLGFGIPSFTQFIANNRMAAAANDVVTSIHAARTEAVKRRQTVSLCASSDWNDGAPGCDLGGGAPGWIVFADTDGDVVVDAGDTVILAHGPVAEGITFDMDPASAPYLQYGGNGFPRTAAAGVPITNIQLCDDRGDVGTGQVDTDGDGTFEDIAAGRWIQIGATGRPQLYRMRADVEGAANPTGGC